MLNKHLFAGLILMTILLFPCELIGGSDEKIRSGYGGRMSPTFLDKLKANGFNAYMWGANRPSPVTGGELKWENGKLTVQYNQEVVDSIARAADWAQERDIKLFVTLTFNEHTRTALQKLGEYGKSVVEGPRAYLGRGEKPAPWPGERKYWNGILQEEVVCIAKIASKHPAIAGILIDVEMYAGDIMWRYNTTFDDNSFDLFRRKYSSLRSIPAVPVGQRFILLKKNGLLKLYYNCLSDIVFERAAELAGAVNNENSQITLGVYPFEINWFYSAFLKGLSRGTNKSVLIFSEKEYQTGYTVDVDATISHLKDNGFAFRYVGGLWIGKHQPFSLAWNAAKLAEKSDGYWLFTTWTLVGDLQELAGTYGHLAAGATQEQYWQAIKAVNHLLDRNHLHSESHRLITPNSWSTHTVSQTKVSYTFNPAPDGLMAEDAERNALFDGLTAAAGTVAWSISPEHPTNTFLVTIDLGQEYSLERIALVVPLGAIEHLKIIDKFTIEVQYLKGQSWNILSRMQSDELQPAEYFNVELRPKGSVKTSKISITFSPSISEDQIETMMRRWDGLFLGLSEVAIWEE